MCMHSRIFLCSLDLGLIDFCMVLFALKKTYFQMF